MGTVNIGFDDFASHDGKNVAVSNNEVSPEYQYPLENGIVSTNNQPSAPTILPLRSKIADIRTILQFAVLILLTTHFGIATNYFLEYSDEVINNTMCDGYGFLLILYIFVAYGFAYVWLIKPYLVPVLWKLIFKPLFTITSRIFGVKFVKMACNLAVLGALLLYIVIDARDDWNRLMPLLGLAIFLILGYVFSYDRKNVNFHTVIWGLILQIVFGLLTIRWEVGRNVFRCAGDKATTFLVYAQEGAKFVYGDFLVNEKQIFAFSAISTIFFLGFFVNVLYYYGIMQSVVSSLGDLLRAIMGTSVCESVCSAANIFLGQSEAPLLLKPYLHNLTAAEIHSVLTSGFATVSGTVFAAYISFGASASNLITSSVMSAPAALCYSKLLYPETEKPVESKDLQVSATQYSSALDAGSKGATEATYLVLGIIANIIAFLASFYFINGVLSWMGILVGFTEPDELWTLDIIMGYIFMPVSFVMGVPWDECDEVGKLIGIKTMVNEFVAFERFQNMTLTPRTKVIATYAICGFANPSSIGMMISALSILIPNKSEIVTRVALRAFFAGCVVCFMTASIAGLLITE